ncbi:unnamed protein product [Caenorhabditis angaria]|uniref:MSP domain-containing protein n=1 Tax=Caenorhabditis angaria TaxID=860376 RepID=A0A9P1I9H1_9PELO|nr:unnamed protein product [Caenorhabditis angaria]
MAIKSVGDLVNLNTDLKCDTPNHELIVYPKFLIFYSENGYKKPCYVKFFIENRDKFPVIFAIKARQKIFRLGSDSHGILKAGEKHTFKLYLLPCDDWPLGINDYAGKQLKIAIENLRIPTCIQPDNRVDIVAVSKWIWKKSMTEWPLERLYTKMSVILEKCQTNDSSVLTLPISASPSLISEESVKT